MVTMVSRFAVLLKTTGSAIVPAGIFENLKKILTHILTASQLTLPATHKCAVQSTKSPGNRDALFS